MKHAQLKAFDAVARAGGFSAAARALDLTQPAVTIQVRSLEDDYDTRLVNRNGPRIALTDTGRQLFDLTRRLFRVEAEARDLLVEAGALMSGGLVLGADSPHLAAPLVARYRAQYPGVHIAMRLGNASDVWQELLEQRVDVALVANPPRDGRMTRRLLCRRGIAALLPRSHRLAGRRRLALKDLDGEPLVLREPRSNTRRLVDKALRTTRADVASVLELDSREAVLESVAAGLGVGFVLDREAGEDARVAAVPIDELADVNAEYLIASRGVAQHRLVGALFNIVEAG